MEKLYQNKEWLEEHYTNLKKPMREIAEECNCSRFTIRRRLIKFSIHIRTNSEAHKGQMPWNKGKPWSEEIKKKISEANTGNILSYETRKKISKNNKGKKRSKITRKRISEARKGMQFSEEHKKHISEARKGIQFSEEHKKHLSEANKGKKRSNETKQKISKSHKGKVLSKKTIKKISEIMKQKYENGYINPFKGKHHTEEWKSKISGSNSPHWNPNRAEVYAPYGENFYNKHLRNERWNLQNGRDLLTGEKLEWGFYSKYHHIDWNKSNDNPDNHVWVNNSTHGKIHSKYKRKYYEIILQKNLQTLKEGKIPESWTKKNKTLFRQENLIQLKLPINQIMEKEWCYEY